MFGARRQFGLRGGASNVDERFDFEQATDEERFEQYTRLRDRRYRELIAAREKEVEVLERGLRLIEEEVACLKTKGRTR